VKKWLLIAAFSGLTSSALSQDSITAQRDRLIESFRSCVIAAALDGIGANSLRMNAENAFLACSTEEQAMRSWFQLGNVSPAVTQSIIVRIKLDLKKTLTLSQ